MSDPIYLSRLNFNSILSDKSINNLRTKLDGFKYSQTASTLCMYTWVSYVYLSVSENWPRALYLASP